MNHIWVESSGTTRTCRQCGCELVIGYSSALPGEPTQYSKWLTTKRWSDAYSNGTRKRPPCLPSERGHTVQQWLKYMAREAVK